MMSYNSTVPTTLEELGNLPMVRCKTCNRPIGKLYNKFIKLRDDFEQSRTEDQFITPSQLAFEQLKINNPCCRANMNNPPRIPIGSYFFDQDKVSIPNTYVIGEHGRCYGDPSVLVFLNTNMVEESKKELITSHDIPIYKRSIPTSNIRYGKRFAPSLIDLSSYIIEEYMNLSEEERSLTIKALWEVFFASMYMRGWKGPGYGYPLEGRGAPSPRAAYNLINKIMNKVTNSDVQSLIAELHKIDIVSKDFYILLFTSLLTGDNNKMLDVIHTYTPAYNDDPMVYIKQVLQYLDQLLGSLIVDVVDYNKMMEHYENYLNIVDQYSGVKHMISIIQAINYTSAKPTRLTYTLKSLMERDDRTLNLSRIMALTAHYTIEVLTGKGITNFNPKIITGDESGHQFPIIAIEFKM